MAEKKKYNKNATVKNNNSTNNKHTTNTKQVSKSKTTTKHVAQDTKQVVKKTKEKAIDHKCPGCRAPIHFVPTLGKWKCEYCDSSFILEELQKFNNASSVENNTSTVALTGDSKDMYVSYKCKNCGAEIVADSQTAATFCVYCGNTAILKSKLEGEFKPDYIIPFKKEKKDAIKAFKDLSKGRPFVPKDFNSEANIEKIRGIYIPFWLYDTLIQGGIEASGQKVRSWTRGDTHYTKTDYYKLYRDGSIRYLKIPIDGSSRFNDDIMSTLEPFDYSEMVPYNHAYLSGFLAERYDIEADALMGYAVKRAIDTTQTIFTNNMVGYTSKVVTNSTLKAIESSKRYALLPVYMVNVKYKDKFHLFAMNGQTGEFIGDIPLDKGKVARWTILWFLGITLGVILLTFIIHMLTVRGM